MLKKSNSIKKYLATFLILFSFFFIIFYSYIFRYVNLEKEPLKLYFADHISEAYQEIIKEFNEKYKGQIEVVPVHIPFEKFSTNDRKELLTRYLRNKSDRIDVFSVDVIWTKRFSKWAVPFDRELSDFLTDSVLTEAIVSCRYDDKYVAAPIFIDIGLMYYKENFVKQTKNFEYYKKKIDSSISFSDLSKIKNELRVDENVYIFPASDYEGLICGFYEIYGELLGKRASNDYFVFDEKAMALAYKTLSDCFNSTKITPKKTLNFRETESLDYFLKGNGIFLRGWPGLERNAKALGYSQKDLENIKIAPTPSVEGRKGRAIVGGWNLMVSKFSNKKEAAFEFIKFFLKYETQKKLHLRGGYAPTNKNVYRYSNSKELNFYFNLIKSKSIHRPYIESYTKISDAISTLLRNALAKNVEANVFVENVKNALLDISKKEILVVK